MNATYFLKISGSTLFKRHVMIFDSEKIAYACLVNNEIDIKLGDAYKRNDSDDYYAMFMWIPKRQFKKFQKIMKTQVVSEMLVRGYADYTAYWETFLARLQEFD